MKDRDPNLNVVKITDACLRGFAGYNIRRAEAVIKSHLQKTLTPFGLRMITFSALAMIDENRGLRPSQLATALSMERANLVVILDELERKGLIERAPSQEDRRAHILDITPVGAKTLHAAFEAVQAHDDWVQRKLSKSQRTDLIAALNLIEKPEGDAP